MQSLRTPEERFEGLPGWSWEPHYAQVRADGSDLRMAYVDERPARPADARTVLLLHGEPSWSYLYRKMIPPLLAAGLRVIAPDLIGFGRSDKPAAKEDYTYARHVAWLTDLVVGQLDLRDALLFCQDWGGLLGLRLVAEHPERFAAVVASNTMLPTGEHDPGEAFKAWREFSRTAEGFDIGRIIDNGTAREIAPEVIAAYDAPYPDDRYKAGARQFPSLVPITPDDPAAAPNRAAWEVLARWQKPFVCAFGDSDPITGGADRVLCKLIPGTAGQPHVTVQRAGHFIQEDAGEQLAGIVIELAERLAREEISAPC
ncbi:MAG TPA: haloalkane dehalogenase [Solirubrobacteraceae bacterium]|nr:haloalkane dehalogenase [Solirubrobacteraceae bacterium]